MKIHIIVSDAIFYGRVGVLLLLKVWFLCSVHISRAVYSFLFFFHAFFISFIDISSTNFNELWTSPAKMHNRNFYANIKAKHFDGTKCTTIWIMAENVLQHFEIKKFEPIQQMSIANVCNTICRSTSTQNSIRFRQSTSSTECYWHQVKQIDRFVNFSK